MGTITRRTVLRSAAAASRDHRAYRTLRARRLCRRQASARVLGPLGARRQRHADEAVQGVGREGKGRDPIDYITSQGDKLLLTGAAEAQARSGHDMLTFLAWAGAAQADALTPLDDVMARADQGERRGARGHRRRRQAEGPLDRDAGVGRQPDAAVLRPDRLFQAICRARPDQDVSGRRAARHGTRRQMDLGQFPVAPPRSATRRTMLSAYRSASPTTRSPRPMPCCAPWCADDRQGRQHHRQIR